MLYVPYTPLFGKYRITFYEPNQVQFITFYEPNQYKFVTFYEPNHPILTLVPYENEYIHQMPTHIAIRVQAADGERIRTVSQVDANPNLADGLVSREWKSSAASSPPLIRSTLGREAVHAPTIAPLLERVHGRMLHRLERVHQKHRKSVGITHDERTGRDNVARLDNLLHGCRIDLGRIDEHAQLPAELRPGRPQKVRGERAFGRRRYYLQQPAVPDGVLPPLLYVGLSGLA